MPKQRITEEMVVDAAFELARAGGWERVTAKAIAGKVGCSVQPIYSYCRSMEGLCGRVKERSASFIREYVGNRIDPNDLFRSTGYAYAQLAREEPYVFQLYLLRQRKNVSSLEDLYRQEAGAGVAGMIAKDMGISLEEARRLHLHMLTYTVGLSTILAGCTPGFSPEEISGQLEQACAAFLNSIKKEGEKENG